MRVGALVKICPDPISELTFGWYRTNDGDVSGRIFHEEVYGIFLEDPWDIQGKKWYKVLVGEKIYVFDINILVEVQ